jgi:hypothetical protein
VRNFYQRAGESLRGLCSSAKEVLIDAAHKGRIEAQTPRALAQLANKQRSHRLAEKAWNPAENNPKRHEIPVHLPKVRSTEHFATIKGIRG